MEEGSQLHSWLKGAIEKVKDEELIPGILSVMLQCGSVLSIAKEMPHLKVESASVCTPEVWKQCRKKLADKMKSKGGVVPTLDWLPTEPPSSAAEINLPGQDEL